YSKPGARLTHRFYDDIGQVLADAVVRHAALDFDAGLRHVRELHGVVGAREDRLREVESNLLLVDVERGDELDVAHVVAAQVDVHQTRHGRLGRSVAIVVNSLHQRRRAVAHTDYRDAHLAVVLTVLMAVPLAVFHALTSSRSFI